MANTNKKTVRYRLKKEMPGFKVGCIFFKEGNHLNYNGCTQRFDVIGIDEIDNFDEWFEEVDKNIYDITIKMNGSKKEFKKESFLDLETFSIAMGSVNIIE